jgi:hypothetical protein
LYRDIPAFLSRTFPETYIQDGILHTPEDSVYSLNQRESLVFLSMLMDKRHIFPYTEDSMEEVSLKPPLVVGKERVDSGAESIQLTKKGFYPGYGEDELVLWSELHPRGRIDFTEENIRGIFFQKVITALPLFFFLFFSNVMFVLSITFFNAIFLFVFINILGQSIETKMRMKYLLLSFTVMPVLLPLFTIADASWRFYGNISMGLALFAVTRVILFSKRQEIKEKDE